MEWVQCVHQEFDHITYSVDFNIILEQTKVLAQTNNSFDSPYVSEKLNTLLRQDLNSYINVLSQPALLE